MQAANEAISNILPQDQEADLEDHAADNDDEDNADAEDNIPNIDPMPMHQTFICLFRTSSYCSAGIHQ